MPLRRYFSPFIDHRSSLFVFFAHSPRLKPSGVMLGVKMSAKENQKNDYVNYDVTDEVTYCEYVYEQGSIDDSSYVYEEESVNLNTTDASILKQKPGHHRRTAGVYDEIDYQLDPQIRDTQKIKSRKAVPTDTTKAAGSTKKEKIMICVVIGGLLIGAITVGIIFALPGGTYNC